MEDGRDEDERGFTVMVSERGGMFWNEDCFHLGWYRRKKKVRSRVCFCR
jgi:hypothetical protein